ncbi:hypothetical protein B0E51_08840 [Rhodanobacter sp. C05]|nr:hypothetical protein B0E51_08840 [Rhodanobacter sp. C05]
MVRLILCGRRKPFDRMARPMFSVSKLAACQRCAQSADRHSGRVVLASGWQLAALAEGHRSVAVPYHVQMFSVMVPGLVG